MNVNEFVKQCNITWAMPWGPCQYRQPGMTLACVSYSLAACDALAQCYKGRAAPRETFAALWDAATYQGVHAKARELNGDSVEFKFVDDVFKPALTPRLRPGPGHLTQEAVNWDVDSAPENFTSWALDALQRREWRAACLTHRRMTSAICVMPFDSETDGPHAGVVWMFDSHGKVSHLEADTVLVGFYIAHGDMQHATDFLRNHMLPRLYASAQWKDVMIDVQHFFCT